MYLCNLLPKKKKDDRNESLGMFLEFLGDDENFDMIYRGVIIKAAVLSDLNDLIFLQYEQQMNIGFLP